MFYSVFARETMDEQGGIRYRHDVFEAGGSQAELEIFDHFLHRRPGIELFRNELGLV